MAAKTISAYIDLNPVRAGMVKDPADYRWSSYGEATVVDRRETEKPRGPSWCGLFGRIRVSRRMRICGSVEFQRNTGNC